MKKIYYYGIFAFSFLLPTMLMFIVGFIIKPVSISSYIKPVAPFIKSQVFEGVATSIAFIVLSLVIKTKIQAYRISCYIASAFVVISSVYFITIYYIDIFKQTASSTASLIFIFIPIYSTLALFLGYGIGRFVGKRNVNKRITT